MELKYPECIDLEDRIYTYYGKQRIQKIKVTCPDCKQGRYVSYGSINKALKKGTFTGRCAICHARFTGKQYGYLIHGKRGEESSAWKGGKHLYHGYVWCTIQPDNPFFCMADRTNRIREHRLIMAKYLGRPLLLNEHIHHVDGNKLNNSIDNLVLLTRSNHQRFEKLLFYGKVKREEVFNYGI